MASVSTTKSSSSWLDRLRSSRGFPIGDKPDLDRFLSTSSSGSAPTRSGSTQTQPAIREHRNSGDLRSDEKCVGEVSNVLCDLFNMGEEASRSFSRKKKSSRKQEKPRFCAATENNNELCSSDDLRRDKSDNGLASSGDNSLNERREKSAAVDAAKFDDLGAEERSELDVDLKAYSRSELFVIDTSLPEWKFDGWVFRKNDDWKIKEKKSKSRVFGGKKRKFLVNNNNENFDKNKKKMKMNTHEESLNKGQAQIEKKEGPFKETTYFLAKIPQKRCPCPRPPDKFGNEGSSAVLLKPIPLSSTSNGAPKLGKSSFKKHPKQMKIV